MHACAAAEYVPVVSSMQAHVEHARTHTPTYAHINVCVPCVHKCVRVRACLDAHTVMVTHNVAYAYTKRSNMAYAYTNRSRSIACSSKLVMVTLGKIPFRSVFWICA